jgi:hypothetical protein
MNNNIDNKRWNDNIDGGENNQNSNIAVPF